MRAFILTPLAFATACGSASVELDTAKLRDQITRSRAAQSSAQAAVAQSGATLKEAQGNLSRLFFCAQALRRSPPAEVAIRIRRRRSPAKAASSNPARTPRDFRCGTRLEWL